MVWVGRDLAKFSSPFPSSTSDNLTSTQFSPAWALKNLCVESVSSHFVLAVCLNGQILSHFCRCCDEFWAEGCSCREELLSTSSISELQFLFPCPAALLTLQSKTQ